MSELDELEETDLSARLSCSENVKHLRNCTKMRRNARVKARSRPKWKHQLAMSKMAATKAGRK